MNPPTPVVFLHAYPLDPTMWQEQVDALSGRTVLIPSFPGFGGKKADATTLDDFAATVLAEMDAANVKRAVIVGLSMGGYVAFRLMQRAPERVAALVLADTRAGRDSDEAAAKRLQQAQRARAEGIGWLADVQLPAVLGKTSIDSRPGVVDRVRKMIDRADPEGVARALDAMRQRPDSTGQLASMQVPVLVVVGEEDTVTPLAEAERIAREVPGARLEVIPGVGHLSNLEDPAAFNRILVAFLQQVDA